MVGGLQIWRSIVAAVVVVAVVIGPAGAGISMAQATTIRVRRHAGRLGIMCPVPMPRPPGIGIGPQPGMPGAGELQVTVPPLVLISVGSGMLRVTTNTGQPPAAPDGFYVVRPGSAAAASSDLIGIVLRTCG